MLTHIAHSSNSNPIMPKSTVLALSNTNINYLFGASEKESIGEDSKKVGLALWDFIINRLRNTGNNIKEGWGLANG